MISDQHAELRLVEVLGVNPPWIAFIADESLQETLRQLAIKESVPPASVQPASPLKIKACFNSGVIPQVVILDLTKSAEILKETKSLLDLIPGSARVIVIGQDDHVSTYRELKHIGVSDYLLMPVQENELHDVIHQALQIVDAKIGRETTVKLKPFTLFVGSRGGVGTSTLCANLAWLTAMEFQKKVCLIDFDFYNGSACILLDLNQNAGLNDALTETERLDETFLKHLLLPKEENFSILTGQLSFDQSIHFSPEALNALINLLRDKFDFIYADLPPTLDTPFSQAILNVADNIIIVTDFSLVSVQGILRLQTYLSTYMPHLKYKLIANNIFPGGGTVAKAMFEKGINTSIDYVLPYCKANMLEGMNAGEPFVKTFPSHGYTQCLRKFILALYPHLKPVETVKPSLLKRWLGSNK